MRLPLTTDKMIQSVLDGYEAKLKVFKRDSGGFVLTDEPDHDIRLKAYDRAVAAFGVIPREVEMPPPARPGLIVIIGRESDQGKVATAKPIDRPTPAGKTFDVTFRREPPNCDEGNTEREP